MKGLNLKLRIGPRLLIGFMICIIFSGIIGAAALINIRKIEKDTDEFIIASDIEKEALECRRQEKNILLFGPHEKATLEGREEKTYLDKLNTNIAALKELVERGKKIAAEEEEYRSILKEIEDYELSLKKIVISYKKERGVDETFSTLGTHIEDMKKNAREVARTAANIKTIAKKRIKATERATSNIIKIVLIVAIVFAGGASVFISRGITNPLSALVKITNLIAKGDLSREASIRTKDEIGELAQSFNKMTKDLKCLMQKEKELAVAAAVGHKRADELEEAYRGLKKMQGALIQAEKFSAVGQLASGIAHEVKNPLAIIVQSVDYLAGKIPTEYKDILGTIKANIKRADNIVCALVDFSRVTKLDIIPQDINSILKVSLILVQHRTKIKSIEIVKEFQKDLPRVLVDKNKIEQVFVNIFLNAIQAISQEGRLIIRTYLSELNMPGNGAEKRNGDSFKLQEKAVVVEIEDTGVGISEENITSVFDPFFTTKAHGIGTGLGLSVTKNIIIMHKGLIEIKSKVGEGTKVIITLKAEGGA